MNKAVTQRNQRSVLGIIPAREGSRGLVGKNMRIVGGKPLISWTVDAVRESKVCDRIVVSSDSPTILGWARVHGLETLERPERLAGDNATLSQVALEIVEGLDWSGVVGIFQVTSPFRSAETIQAAFKLLIATDCGSVSSATPEEHLAWYADDGDLSGALPLFKERVNRQFNRSSVLRETGAVQFVDSEVLLEGRDLVGRSHRLLLTSAEEGIDIDTIDDLQKVRRLMERGLVVLRLRANSIVGSGHLHHCLQLAEELADHELQFLLVDCDSFVKETLEDRGYPFTVESDLESDLRGFSGRGPKVVVNDVLDTTEKEVLTELRCGYRVVNIEDLGSGARLADWVVNALYAPTKSGAPNADAGPDYATLRPEFRDLPPKAIRQEASKVLVTFGGTDPSHLSARVSNLLSEHLRAEITLLVGSGIQEISVSPSVRLKRHVKNMAEEMFEADVIVTSAGRTVFEAAATGTPVVVIAANAREATHSHVSLDSGVVFLGVGTLVTDNQIVEVVERLLAEQTLRKELSERLRRMVDHRGAERIADGIRAIMKGTSG